MQSFTVAFVFTLLVAVSIAQGLILVGSSVRIGFHCRRVNDTCNQICSQISKSVCFSEIPTSGMIGQDCTSAGFFREPSDCTRFYRCTDPWGAGNYQKFPFECPAGTVFDELVGVCNWPQLAAPCGESPPAPPAPGPAPLPPPPPPPPGKRANLLSAIKRSVYQSSIFIAFLVSGTGDDIVVISPTFSFQCTAQGWRHARLHSSLPTTKPEGQ